MKNRKQNTADNKVYNAFTDFYSNEEEVEKAMSDAKKAFSFIKQDRLHKDFFHE